MRQMNTIPEEEEYMRLEEKIVELEERLARTLNKLTLLQSENNILKINSNRFTSLQDRLIKKETAHVRNKT